MKRSHMVLKIAESLVEPRFPDDAIKEADSILKRLENSGMLPPPYTYVPGADGKKIPSFIGSGKTHEWEPEDGDDDDDYFHRRSGAV